MEYGCRKHVYVFLSNGLSDKNVLNDKRWNKEKLVECSITFRVKFPFINFNKFTLIVGNYF